MAEETLHPVDHAMSGGSHGLLARFYYHLKPYLPLDLRWAVRRYRIPGILKRSAGFWPIDECAAGAPLGWPGWPHNKQFALVFTHDVESTKGVHKVRKLAELELTHGFRSSFNFIPEGSYDDPFELRGWLDGNGFEVGVHDLCHDGHLYQSREEFRRNAKSINRYLRDWGASGFRSGFMLHRLDWLHDLDVVYDASTFDTDPFEPQPDGTRTIFPFHVQPPAEMAGPGYVELPYTLPQDSTLFLLLRETNFATWRRKLDWIARNGGMALVNIHPDYVDFSDNPATNESYPSSLLSGFMEYIREHYANAYWNPLARELATWYRSVCSDASAASEQSPPLPPPHGS